MTVMTAKLFLGEYA